MFSKLPWSSPASDDQQHQQQQQQQQQGQGRTQSGDGEEQSLTTVLSSPEDRSSLLVLVADCTHAMRTRVCAVFDPRLSKGGIKDRVEVQEQETKEQQEHEQEQEQGSVQNQETEEDTAAFLEKQRLDQQRRLQELSSPEMQALKKAALEYFDDWRDRVLGRVGEAVNAKPKMPTTSDEKEQNSAAAQQPPIKTLDETTRDEESAAALNELYPPQSTSLAQLDKAQRALVLHSLLLLILSLERYSAESRVLLLHLTSSLHLPLSALTDDESKVARGLLEAAKRQMSADEETKKKAAENSGSRAWKVGLGTVAGAALIGVTGGLAAPLLAAGVGSVMGGLGLGTTVAATYLGAMAGSAPLVGVLFGAYGGRMTGQSIDRYAKDVDDFAFLPVHKAPEQKRDIFHRHDKNKEAAAAEADADTRRLRVAIGISGWLTNPTDIVKPWLVISPSIEAFALRFELDAMMSLGNALVAYVKSYAWGWAKKEIISRTVFGALTAALWPLGLLKVARVVDNPFSVAKARADKAGAVLADALANRVQGERPVTLVGYSLGARTIYVCLAALAERRAFGLVESVVLLGAPAPSDPVHWRKMRSVVAGRVVNVYSSNDYLLAFLYRTASLQLGVAGLQAVRDVPGVENVDVSALVDGHTKYRYLTGSVLKRIGFEDVDRAEVEKQEGALRVVEEKEKEEREAKEKHEDAGELEREAEKGKSEGMMGWVQNTMGAMGVGGGDAEGKKGASRERVPEREEKLREQEKMRRAEAPAHA